jgi:hypothetical protein
VQGSLGFPWLLATSFSVGGIWPTSTNHYLAPYLFPSLIST